MRFLCMTSLLLAAGLGVSGQISEIATPLSVKVSHSGKFLLGQTNAYFLVRVSNPGKTASTGSVVVTENALSGLTVTARHGEGWQCSLAHCMRSDTLPAGGSYPAIMVVARVDETSPLSLLYTAKVTKNGVLSASASDTVGVEAHGYPIAWGYNSEGEASVPAGLSDVVAMCAAGYATAALRKDGKIVIWGQASPGLGSNLSNVVAIACGGLHGLFLLGNGTVKAIGDNTYGQSTVPPGLSNVVAIGAGAWHSLAVKGDGTVVAWGDNSLGETTVPATLKNAVAVAGGGKTSLALKSDGTVAAWGDNSTGLTNVPPDLSTPGGTTHATAIAASHKGGLALKSDGTVAAWGDLPAAPANLKNVTAIATLFKTGLALGSGGLMHGWGNNQYGDTEIPPGLKNVFAVGGGSIADSGLAVTSVPPGLVGTTIGTNVYCLGFKVDGSSYFCSVLFDWVSGSAHTIATTSPQVWGMTVPNETGSYPAAAYTFAGWKDGNTSLSRTIHTPLAGGDFTAEFNAQYAVLLFSNPAGAGTFTVNGNPAATATPIWFAPGASVSVTATPATGYKFTGWTSTWTCAASSTSCAVNMNQGGYVIANFAVAP